jgi:hypothetical protein
MSRVILGRRPVVGKTCAAKFSTSSADAGAIHRGDAIGGGPLVQKTRRQRVMDAVRRTHSLPAEMLLLAAVVGVWQLVRVPFESSLAEAVAGSDRLVDAERAIGVLVEPDAIRAFAARPALLDAANWFYSHMDETLVFGAYAALRLIEPVRFAAMRTAFAVAHLPAVAVVAAFPAAPPRWVPGMPFAAPPAAGIGGDLRNSTAAAVSLHVGIPILIAASAVWARPRSPLAWATVLYPALVAAVVVGTGNHLLADIAVGGACAAIGIAGARLVHGRVPRGRRTAGAPAVAGAAALAAGIAYAVNAALVG